MDRSEAIAVLDQLHQMQNDFYSGGDDEGLRRVLSNDIVWTVPGSNSIAGIYRGVEEVLAYFSRRRSLADTTFKMHRLDVLVGDGERIAALTDGTAMINGFERSWSTVGLYDVIDKRVAACWLLPLDPVAFDAIWSV